MYNLGRVQSRVSKEARIILDHVWDQFVATGDWPLRREISPPFGGRDKLEATLANLDFGYIFEADPYDAPVMKMQLHGILCTRDSWKHSELLTAYLRLLRGVNKLRPSPKSIDQSQAADMLRLEPHEIPMLGRLLSIVSDRSVFRANHTTNPKTYETWSFNVPDSVDEIPDGNAANFFDSLLPSYSDSRSIWRSGRQAAGPFPLAVPGETFATLQSIPTGKTLTSGSQGRVLAVTPPPYPTNFLKALSGNPNSRLAFFPTPRW
jgi:hypothetical protein